jgi:hypothetical protein
MCDYSLMGIPNRLATEGEELVTYRFSTGSVGLAPPLEVRALVQAQETARRGFWGVLREIFSGPALNSVRAVCIPPGARLILKDIPQALQHSLGVAPTEEVIFTQITATANRHRDAVRFGNRKDIRLQELAEGQRVRVLDLSSSEPREPEMDERSPYLLVR